MRVGFDELLQMVNSLLGEVAEVGIGVNLDVDAQQGL
jgi:hypothetical protein